MWKSKCRLVFPLIINDKNLSESTEAHHCIFKYFFCSHPKNLWGPCVVLKKQLCEYPFRGHPQQTHSGLLACGAQWKAGKNIMHSIADETLLYGVYRVRSGDFGWVRERMSPITNSYVEFHVNTANRKWTSAMQYWYSLDRKMFMVLNSGYVSGQCFQILLGFVLKFLQVLHHLLQISFCSWFYTSHIHLWSTERAKCVRTKIWQPI